MGEPAGAPRQELEPALARPRAEWSPLQDACSAVSYGLTTNDHPRSVAGYVAAVLPEDVLAQLKTYPAERVVEYLEAQRDKVPALSNPALAERRGPWLTAFAKALRGDPFEWDDEDDDDDDEEEEEEEGEEEDEDDEDLDGLLSAAPAGAAPAVDNGGRGDGVAE